MNKSYGTLQVLQDITFTFESGASIAITGPSGSGKSTLLHIIGTLESPTQGTVEIDGINPFELSEPEIAQYRNLMIGFVFQDHHLLPQYSVLENILLPTLAFRKKSDATEYAENLIQKVGLSERISHRPGELSGGERQRAAIARALINRPSIILCDEPTGNLDEATTEEIANLLFDLHSTENTLLIVVTHNLNFASKFTYQLNLVNGKCVANTQDNFNEIHSD
ncbi:ABC transporter ATP-binding protein [Candidatus Poribacteria bacterium]|nr:ABC transporter ATP-binding protein [Candidatus Poribacteria bacterium]